MAIIGLVLLILGWVLALPLLLWLGAVLLIVGLVLLFVPVGGRRWY